MSALLTIKEKSESLAEELADRDYKISVSELERAFSESLQALKLLDVRSTLYVESGLTMLSGKTAASRTFPSPMTQRITTWTCTASCRGNMS